MRITRIDVEGLPGRYATLTRKRGTPYIDVEILCPDLERTHHVLAYERDDKWSMAEGLHEVLEGFRGTNTDIRDYFDLLERLA